MSRYERWNRLLELVAEHGHLEVADTARVLDVSEATIRRDLDQLAEQRMLTRTRGGATGSSQLAHELPLLYKTARNAPEKRRIGRAAAALVALGATVALNGGTTTIEVARALGGGPGPGVPPAPGGPGHAGAGHGGAGHGGAGHGGAGHGGAGHGGAGLSRAAPGGTPLTVVTNALSIAGELAIRPHVKLVVTGGVARPESSELIGPLGTHVLGELLLDWAILGVDGLDAVAGATAHHEGEASINRLMASRAQRVAIVADGSKLGRRTFARVCGVDEIDVLVTDAAADEPAVAALADKGIQVITA
jgi:DeoR family transcriptional regulator of aga operon